MKQIEAHLKGAEGLVNSANQIVIYFDKPEDISLEDIMDYIRNLDRHTPITAGCGDPE